LQRTANEIERQYRAAELLLDEYATNEAEESRLKLLIERVESIRAEQADRERKLEQPADAHLPTGLPST
jgi:hypothetical protein